MAVINFSLPATALGLTVTVYRNDTELSTGTLTDDVSDSGMLVYSVTVDEASDVPTTRYTAEVSSAMLGTIQAQGVLDTRASIADVPGAAETAYLVATGPTFATDANYAAVTLVADAREAALPDWITIVNGEAVLDSTAGTCVFAVRGQASIDYSGTTPPDAPDDVFAAISITADGSEVVTTPDAIVAADGTDTQTSGVTKGGGVVTESTVVVTANAYNTNTSVTDGVATPSVALTITRVAPAPVLPV